MSFTHGIGVACGKIIRLIVRGLALSRIHPNVLTFLGLVISNWAGFLMARGEFGDRIRHHRRRTLRYGRWTRRPRDESRNPLRWILRLRAGPLLRSGGIHRTAALVWRDQSPIYVVLTALAMTAGVMISYARARAENTIPTCKVGFLERPERVVLITIGALFDRMAQVLWVTACSATITVVHRTIDLPGSQAIGRCAMKAHGKSRGFSHSAKLDPARYRALKRIAGFH